MEMTPICNNIYYFDDDFRLKVDPKVKGFLRQMDGLTIFDIKGKDPSRTRVMTTLIHGNEPSGFIASHAWLMSSSIPATNIRIIYCNPEAARHKPKFTRRYVGECEDLNRYFGDIKQPDDDLQQRADLIKTAIAEVNPEAVIDMHNTSGSSPAFSVSVCDSPESLYLTSLFADKMVYIELSFGTLMENKFGCPIVTIECGGANDILSHEVAIEGLSHYFEVADLFDHIEREVSIHRHPIRIEVVGDNSVGYASHKLPLTDISIISDIEQFNSHITPKGEFLGWLNEDDPILPLQALDEEGVDQIARYLYVDGGRIYAAQTMQMFMATTCEEIAANDCLFYVTI
jgi:hypothetical protein